MAKFNFGAFFGAIEPLADALRSGEERVWAGAVGKNPRPVDYVLYLGCNVLRTVDLVETVVAVLKSMGVDFVALAGPAHCCGIVHERNGEQAAGRKMLAHTFRNFAAFRPKAVLVYCPTCQGRMDALIPDGVPLDIPTQTVVAFLAEHIGRLPFTTPVPRRVALHGHDATPQAARDLEATGRVLAAVPGLEVVPMAAGAEWGTHCMAAQIAKVGPPRFEEMVDELFGEAKQRGADVLTTVYHSCYREHCAREPGAGMGVANYIQFVAQGLGMEVLPEKFKSYKIEADPERAFAELAATAQRRGVGPLRLRRSLEAHFKPG
ncbi:MAG: (Fe-S)-binding protein [bacterium]